MPGRALLIGVAVDGLTGVENDVAVMAEALTARGLTVEPPLTGKDATRDGILEAYERLIADVSPGETAVVYYSGHGGRVLPPLTGTAGPELMDLQFIVPFDFHDSGPDHFRGITSVELSVLLARLTQKTDNVVAVFDCCHSGHISRNELRVKALPRATPYERLRAHIERLEQEQGLRTDLMRSTGNPHAVRIVACAPEQAAFEYPGAEGKQIGVFTEALTMSLRAAGTERVSWATLLDGVRYRVAALISGQRPEAEGPAHRVLFSTEEDDRLDSLQATVISGGRLSLACAPLLGVRPGDAFTVWSQAGDRIGDLTVDRVGPLAAQGPVTLAAGVAEVPVGARARPLATTGPRLAVSVPAGDPRGGDLRQAIAVSPVLRVAEEDEPWGAQVLIDADGALTVADRFGPLREPRPNDQAGVAATVRDLMALARAAALRGLSSDTRWSLNAAVTCEWGLVRDGAPHRLPDSGATVRAGEAVFVSVRNEGDTPVYATLVDIGVSGRVEILTAHAPSGVRLAPGELQEYVYGFDDYSGVLEGIVLGWPDGLDPAYARPETMLLFVTSDPHDLSALVQPGIAKDLRPAPGRGGRYDVRALEFEVEPPAGEFLVEEVSTPLPGGLTSRVSPPAAVAVRLDEVVVHRNRARFGGADVRVDAIVLTGAPDSPQPTFRARTERFSRIHDGEPLPLDRMLVYHGPAVDYLDIALWVSRDSAGALDLGELLTDEVAGFEVQEALAKMSGAMTGLPYASAAVAVVGVGAVVVNLAYRLLRGAVSDVIGLYRGSMLAGEGFGVGRHPVEGVRRVQDFSFAYSIDDVS